MKFVSYDNQKPGILIEDSIIDLQQYFNSIHSPNIILSILDLIEHYDEVEPYLHDISIIRPGENKLINSHLLSPLTNPSKIICAVDNYPTHANEFATEVFPKPIFFMKPSTSLLQNNGSIILPGYAKRVDHELELAVIIGKKCKNVRACDALSVVFGYSIFLDISARDFRTIPYSWFSMKAWDTFSPFGPVIVTRDEILDPQNLEMKLWVNHNLKMCGNTKDMVFSIPQLIESISEVTTLLPGDIIATGTIDGVDAIKEGDVIYAEIEKIGQLTIDVVSGQKNHLWHDEKFPLDYSTFRDRDTGDKGKDPITPKDS